MSRPTFLHFRDPDQRTPEFRINSVTYTSQRLKYAEMNSPLQELVEESGENDRRSKKSGAKSGSPPINRQGNSFARADRFSDDRFYCNSTG